MRRSACRSPAGANIAAGLVIGADGSDSAVRKIAGIGVRGWGYEQRAVVTHLAPERPHAATAWQRFLDTGPLALLPLAGRARVAGLDHDARAAQRN